MTKQKENNLTQFEKRFIIDDLLVSLNSSYYGLNEVRLKDVKDLKQKEFNLSGIEFTTIISIIKKLKKKAVMVRK